MEILSDYKEFAFKNFAYGSQNFKEFIQNGNFYVDRTNFIPLLESAGKVLLFLRPKRFGKTLTVSMLEHYYGIQYKDEFQNMFGKLHIGKNPTQERNQYLTMTLSLAFINVTNGYEAFEKSLSDIIKNGCIKFVLNYYSLLDMDEKVEIAKIENLDSIIYFQRLTDLVACHAIYKGKFYLFIDEYDSAMNHILFDTSCQLYQELCVKQKAIASATAQESCFRRLFSCLKVQLRSSFGRVYITGISSVSLSSICSPFVADNISNYFDFAGMCGFTFQEIADFLKGFKKPEKADRLLTIMKKCYNGYRFHYEQKETVFNPQLVTYFLKTVGKTGKLPVKLLDPHLGISKILSKIFSQSPLTSNILTELIVNDQIVITEMKENFEIDDVSSLNSDKDSILSLMFQHGALTYHENKQNHFVIPNLEMRQEFIDKLIAYLEINEQFFSKMQNAIAELAKDNVIPLCAVIKDYYLSKLSSGDSKHSLEQDLKSSFFIILHIFCKDYLKSKVENEFDVQIKNVWGQIDLLLMDKFHFEFKNIQIKDLVYDDEDLRKNCGKNEFEYLTKLSDKLDKENDETAILELRLREGSFHCKNSVYDVKGVWKNLVNQTKLNHEKLKEKLKSLGKAANEIKSFAIMRVGLYRLKMEKIQIT